MLSALVIVEFPEDSQFYFYLFLFAGLVNFRQKMDSENIPHPCDRCAQKYTKRILVTGGAGFM